MKRRTLLRRLIIILLAIVLLLVPGDCAGASTGPIKRTNVVTQNRV